MNVARHRGAWSLRSSLHSPLTKLVLPVPDPVTDEAAQYPPSLEQRSVLLKGRSLGRGMWHFSVVALLPIRTSLASDDQPPTRSGSWTDSIQISNFALPTRVQS